MKTQVTFEWSDFDRKRIEHSVKRYHKHTGKALQYGASDLAPSGMGAYLEEITLAGEKLDKFLALTRASQSGAMELDGEFLLSLINSKPLEAAFRRVMTELMARTMFETESSGVMDQEVNYRHSLGGVQQGFVGEFDVLESILRIKISLSALKQLREEIAKTEVKQAKL